MRKQVLTALLSIAIIASSTLAAQGPATGSSSQGASDTESAAATELKKLRVTITPYAESILKVSSQMPLGVDSAEASLQVEADYASILGAKIKANFDFTGPNSMEMSGFFYVHTLQVFGLNPELFDLYLRGGAFDADMHSEQNAGQDTWQAGISSIS